MPLDRLGAAGSLDAELISTCYDYSRQWYWDGSAPSNYFTDLRMMAAFAAEVLPLLSTVPAVHGTVVACLLIVLRDKKNHVPWQQVAVPPGMSAAQFRSRNPALLR